MGKALPAIHGSDHTPGGPDPIRRPVNVTSDDSSVTVAWTDDYTVDLSVPAPYTPPNLRETFTGIPDTLADGASSNQRWTFNVGDDLVDLTDPRLPLVRAAGVYAVTVNVDIDLGLDVTTVPAGYWGLRLALDAATSGIANAWDKYIVGATRSLSCTHYIPAGGEILCNTLNKTGSSFDFEMFSASITRIT